MLMPLSVPCDGCVRRQCPHLCQLSERDDTIRSPTRAEGQETSSLGASRSRTTDSRTLQISASEHAQANDPITIPSMSSSNPSLVSRDHVSVVQPTWSNLTQVHNLSEGCNVARGNDEAQYQQLHLDALTGCPNEIQQVQSVESGPSANFGSLRLDTGGRSRYFGPTAASQWLRDVSRVCCSCSHCQVEYMSTDRLFVARFCRGTRYSNIFETTFTTYKTRQSVSQPGSGLSQHHVSVS